MKIEKSCSKSEDKGIALLADIPVGTVFRFGVHKHGPYLRTDDGYVDLGSSRSLHYPPTFTNYLLPAPTEGQVSYWRG